MAEVLYMPDIESNYIKEFETRVRKVKKGAILLEETAFYPTGGGQPCDTGIMLAGDGNGILKVVEVTKKGDVKHMIDVGSAENAGVALPQKGDRVTCRLDWKRRYAHMRMHTAQHLVSGVVYDEYGGRTVGNQIHADHSRIDFHPVSLTADDLKRIEDMTNDIISMNIDVEIKNEERVTLEARVDSERCNLDMLPESVTDLRVVTIGEYDICPCAGTHVRNTCELGKIRIMKKDNKGAQRQRIVYELF